MIKIRAVLAVFASLAFGACGGAGGDPLQEQLRADIEQAEAQSLHDLQEGFVSRWEYNGQPMFASCLILSSRRFQSAKIYPHGGTTVSITLGDGFRDRAEWRQYCSSPMSDADGAPIAKTG